MPEPGITESVGLAYTLCCLMAYSLLLSLTKRACDLGGKLCGGWPRGGRKTCASARAAGKPRRRTIHSGQRRSVRHATRLLLLLAARLEAGAAADVCSKEPRACDGSYPGTTLCAALPNPPHTNLGRQKRSIVALSSLLCGRWNRLAKGLGVAAGPHRRVPRACDSPKVEISHHPSRSCGPPAGPSTRTASPAPCRRSLESSAH